MKIYQGKTQGGISWHTEVVQKIEGMIIYKIIYDLQNGSFWVPRIPIPDTQENIDGYISNLADKNDPENNPDEWR